MKIIFMKNILISFLYVTCFTNFFCVYKAIKIFKNFVWESLNGTYSFRHGFILAWILWIIASFVLDLQTHVSNCNNIYDILLHSTFNNQLLTSPTCNKPTLSTKWDKRVLRTKKVEHYSINPFVPCL